MEQAKQDAAVKRYVVRADGFWNVIDALAARTEQSMAKPVGIIDATHMPLKMVAAEIIADVGAEIPFSFNDPMSWDIHGMIKVAVLDVCYEALFGKGAGGHHWVWRHFSCWFLVAKTGCNEHTAFSAG